MKQAGVQWSLAAMSVNPSAKSGDIRQKERQMFTLKIKWMRYEQGEGNFVITADETTLFIPADEIKVHGVVPSMAEMKSWPEGTFFNYAVQEVDSTQIQPSRLIQVDRENHPSVWYLASNAWILGPDGKTIERVA